MPCAPRIESGEVDYHAGMLRKVKKPGNVRRHLRALARIGTEAALRAMVVEGIGSKRPNITTGARIQSPEKRVRELVSAGILPIKELENAGMPFEKMLITAEELAKLGDKGLRAITDYGFPGTSGIGKAYPGVSASRFERDQNLSRNSLAALSAIALTNPKALKLIAKHGLNHKYPDVASEAVTLLAIAKANGLLIRHGLTHRNEDVRKGTQQWLSFDIKNGFMEEKDIMGLGRMIRDGNPQHAKSAVDTLMFSKSPRATKPLVKYGLKGKDVSFASICAEALVWTGDKRAVKPLIKYGLGHADPIVVAAAARALGSMGDERALVPLMRLADHEDKEVRKHVKAAIMNLQGRG
jgi:hypothetical protein